jgi:uncharacterized membrane protein
MTSAVKGLACNLTVLGRDSKRCHHVVAFARRERESRAKGTVQMHGRDVQGQTSSGVVAMPENVKKMLVAAAAGILLSSTALPEDSWAARSGGRVGGRAFRSAPRAAPRSSPRMGRSGGTYTAPPLVGGYGRGYGGYGYGFPMFAPPIFFFNPLGSIFQLFLLLAAVQFVMGVAKNITTQKGFMDDDDDKDIFD